MPVELNGTVTRFATVSSATKLRLETVGIVVPSGKTVRNPEAVGLTAVTLSTAADAPAGTVPSPVTCTFSVAAAARAFPAFAWPEFGRVSVMRKGVTGT
jgi:hypothetical protein